MCADHNVGIDTRKALINMLGVSRICGSKLHY